MLILSLSHKSETGSSISENDRIDSLIDRLSPNSDSSSIFSPPFCPKTTTSTSPKFVTPSSYHPSVDSAKGLLKKSNKMVISAPKQMEKILNNTIVEPENKCEALPEYFKCIKSLVSYCHNNPNELNTDGKDFLSLLDGRSKQYIASKKSILKSFFRLWRNMLFSGTFAS